MESKLLCETSGEVGIDICSSPPFSYLHPNMITAALMVASYSWEGSHQPEMIGLKH